MKYFSQVYELFLYKLKSNLKNIIYELSVKAVILFE